MAGILAIAAYLTLGLSACGSDSDSNGGGASCQNLTGSWSLSGSCTTTSCEVSVSGSCAMKATCTDGSSLTGTVSGTTFQLSGTSSCSGSVNGTNGSISCTSTAGSCSSSLTCESGPCTSPTTIGGSSTDLGAFCNKCAVCVTESGFSEGFCTPFAGANGSFDLTSCKTKGDVSALANPTASLGEVAGWSCQQFDDNE